MYRANPNFSRIYLFRYCTFNSDRKLYSYCCKYYYEDEDEDDIITYAQHTPRVEKVISQSHRPVFSAVRNLIPKETEIKKRPITSKTDITITAEIHARSLANFCQYVDRHMNLKFMRRVSEREPTIRQFVIVKNKLTSVINASVLLLIMKFVITLSK